MRVIYWSPSRPKSEAVDSRLRQALAASVTSRSCKRAISLPRVSFLDDENADPEIGTNSDGWMGVGTGTVEKGPRNASKYGLFCAIFGGDHFRW